MSRQHSQKEGLPSNAQREGDSRYGYEPHPDSKPKPGAFGAEPRREDQVVPGNDLEKTDEEDPYGNRERERDYQKPND
jgi:hypothetical protein